MATEERNANGEIATNDATAPAENGQGENQQQQQQQESPWKGILFRIFIFWFVTNLFRGKQQQPSSDSPSGMSLKPATNLFNTNQKMELYVYLSELSNFQNFEDKGSLIWHQKDLQFGNWTDGPAKDGVFMFSTQLKTSENLMNNGSLYAHVYITKIGKNPNPASPKFDKRAVVYRSKMLTVYKKRRVSKTVNLLYGSTEAPPEQQIKDPKKEQEIINYWHPNLTINMMDDQTPWTPGSVPPPMDEFIEFDNVTSKYYPLLYLNTYWNLGSEYMPINETTPTLDLHLTYSPISLFKWQMYESQRMRQKWFSVLGDDMQQSEEEQDAMKRTIVETNPYLLGVTMIVTLVHTVFEFLAFKNDIQFWRSRKTLEGLSVRSVFFNVFQATVVLLYVADNDTNTVIIISCFVGLLIELWKINKVVNIKLDRENRILGMFPRISFEDKESYVESSTRVYDQMAFKYLSWALFPLLVCYCIYSLFYVEHKGWYSWVLSMLYGFLLTFGFITMTPQLFINYKLKSVAHLPWRMMTYKALNTFIDDLFAFVIKMPMMYRIGCFRDDIVFFIYLYQRWIYKVDHKRVNEFGLTGEDLANGGAPVEDAAQGTQQQQVVEGTSQASDKKND
ncbi:cleft lip and palate transmembrane protein 1 homolog [Nematostella vectensis]|uniref:cleft lip and palate transmembrane protein 1 homolog n=1 Tax=Nematostella vectensis TaxID=45351 RepID=UPI00138FFCFC|nr:cleft lip and palate transmembrane protein 1 homolog [Nematostella vectensis]